MRAHNSDQGSCTSWVTYHIVMLLNSSQCTPCVCINILSMISATPKGSGIFDIHIEKDGETLTNVDSEQDQVPALTL